LDNDLKLKHDVLDIEKGRRRWRMVRNIVISLVPVILSYYAILYLNFNSGLAIFFVLTLLGSVMVFLIIIYSSISILRAPLSPMERAFEAIYEALSKTWPSTDGARELSPDETYIKAYIQERLAEASRLLGEDEAGEALGDEIGELLDRTQDNIEDRLIPALESGKLSQETLTSLAKVFGTPSFESLKSVNTVIEKDHQTPWHEPTESPIKKQLSELRRRGMLGLLMSIALGFGTAGLILPVIALFLQENPFPFYRDHIDALVGAGALLSALYAQVLKKGARED
jgi:hypothetical protein